MSGEINNRVEKYDTDIVTLTKSSAVCLCLLSGQLWAFLYQ